MDDSSYRPFSQSGKRNEIYHDRSKNLIKIGHTAKWQSLQILYGIFN